MDDARVGLLEVLQEDAKSKWGRYFTVNQFLVSLILGVLWNSLWIEFTYNPVGHRE